jgi:hypothetical protein
MTYFEVIEIIDNSQPYPTLMGLEWAVDNQTIINLKRREMIFEVKDLKVIAPLDPSEGKRYTESVRANDMENLYNLTTNGGLCRANNRWCTQLEKFQFVHIRFRSWSRELAVEDA